MASCGRTVNRALMLVLLAVALAMAIIGVFVPFYSLSESAAATAHANSANALPAGVTSASMTLWDATLTYADGEDGTREEKLELRSQYYTCKQGKTNIQVAEAFAVVTCVVCCANLILSIFTFFFSPVVRVPLAVYSFLGAACAGVTIGVMVHGYMKAWCPLTDEGLSMKAIGWSVRGAGLPMFVVSAALSVAVCLMSAICG